MELQKMKTKRLNIRLEDGEREKLEEMSNQTGLTFTEIFKRRVLGEDLILDQLNAINENVLSIKKLNEEYLTQLIGEVVTSKLKEVLNEN
jgi:hypothetical protein